MCVSLAKNLLHDDVRTPVESQDFSGRIILKGKFRNSPMANMADDSEVR